MKSKKLIIFDFDGTLINSIPDLTLSVNKMLSHYNLPSLSIKETTPFIGNGARPLVERSLRATMPENEVSETLINEAFDIYFSAYKKVTCKDTFLYDGVIDTLEYLKVKGYIMVICTNKPYYFVEPILDKLNLKIYFKDWIGEDSLDKKKPNAEPLLYLANKFGTKIEDCVMIGDSKNDILAAQNANMDSIGLTYGYNYNENIADYNPTKVIEEFSLLQNIF